MVHNTLKNFRRLLAHKQLEVIREFSDCVVNLQKTMLREEHILVYIVSAL